MRLPAPIISYMLKAIVRDCRISILSAREVKREFKNRTDVLFVDEIPKAGTFSGWMRNEREASEYIGKLLREKQP